MPRAANPPARAYFAWNISPRQRQEVMAPTMGIRELYMATLPIGFRLSSLL